MNRAVLVTLQLTAATFATAAVASFSDWPRTRQIPDEAAVVKLSFSHAAERGGDCRRLMPEEIARLPSNMRRVVDCPRGRPPVLVELVLDDRKIYEALLPPSGLSRDGPSRTYQRFVVPAGSHRIAVALRDTQRTNGFDHRREQVVDLSPGQNFVIDFRPAEGGFVFN